MQAAKQFPKRPLHNNLCGIDSGLSGLKVVTDLANRLHRWRAEQQLPLKRVASDLGVSIAIVSAWENGDRFPSVEHLVALAGYMRCPVCHLLYDGTGACPNRVRLGED